MVSRNPGVTMAPPSASPMAAAPNSPLRGGVISFTGRPAHMGDESRKAAAGAIQTAAAKIQRTGLRSRPPPARLVPGHAGALGATTVEIDKPALMIHEA